jgi:hypothetical protein
MPILCYGRHERLRLCTVSCTVSLTKKFIQEVCGVFLFLAHVVDGGLLLALRSLASQQAKPTEKTMELCKKFLDYMATQEEAILTYRASKMVLAIHSNALYLSEPKAHS